MAVPKRLSNRYDTKECIAQGGMGEVYRAYDIRMGCEVAIKIMRILPEPKALELFEREWKVLAGWDAPNVVSIFDRGEYQEEGVTKPFFVMPLLRGATLADLIANGSQRLTVARSVSIICQACKGLQAAHDRGLIHRDLKPSNIFVLEDDSVKIIDFGVAHMVDSASSRLAIGTLPYMAPEQLEMKAVSPFSDIFSLGVVSYETFTGFRPFDRPTEREIVDAILHETPPPVSQHNPTVSELLSRVIRKAMAKQPCHRFSSAREFAETLGKALRGEPMEMFDPARIQPRISRARNAYEQRDYQFAADILNELEAEGNLDADISALRCQINRAVQQKTIDQLLGSARARLEEDECPLALQKILQVLELDPENAAALGLKSTIEKKNTQRKIEGWFRLAQQHISKYDYDHAREAVENVLKASPQDGPARQLLGEIDRRADEYLRRRQEKQQVFNAAQEAWARGDLGTALDKMSVVLELNHQAPDTTPPEGSATYQDLYNRIRSEHEAINNACGMARMHLKEGRFDKALAICDEYLRQYPGHPLLTALKLDVEEQQRHHLLEFITETDRRVEAESDLDKRASILEEALDLQPGEVHFQKALRLVREKRDLVNAISAKARLYEEKEQFNDALEQWEMLGILYNSYPGLKIEVERLVKRRDHQIRGAARERWVESIDRSLRSRDYGRALDTCKRARSEFAGDPELAELERQASAGMELQTRVHALLAQGQELSAQQRFEESLEALRTAYRLDVRSQLTQAVLCDSLAERAQNLLETDWQAAEALMGEALAIAPGHALANSLRKLVGDRKQNEFVDGCAESTRQQQAAGDLEGASDEAGRGLAVYSQEPRLSQLRVALSSLRVQSGPTFDDHRESPEPHGPSLEPPAEIGEHAAGEGQHSPERLVRTALDWANGHFWPGGSKLRREGIGAAVLIVALLACVGLVTRILKSGPLPPAAPGIVRRLDTSPPGARIRIDNKDSGISPFDLRLQEGTHKIDALKDGYQPLSQSLTVQRGSSEPLHLYLTPMATTLSVFTDLKAPQIWLEGQPAGQMKDGQFVLELPAGRHNLRVSGGDATATVLLEVRPGNMPALTSAITTKGLKVVVLSALGSHGEVQSTFGSKAVALDGKPLGEMGSEGLELKDLTRGSHLLAWGQGKDQGMKQFEASAAPALTIWLMSERAVGNLLVRADQDDAQVWVNGEEKGSTKNGSFRIPNLPAREYVVAVTKEEYESDPEEQSVNVVKGSDRIVDFKLRPAKAPEPAPNPQDKLRQQARDAYANQHYVFPARENAVYYWKQLLELDPKSDDYKARLNDSLQGALYQAGQALRQNDFERARQIADALAELLPERGKDVSSLRDDIQHAQDQYEKDHRPPSPPPPVFSARVRHLHAHKAYCQGTLSVSAHQLKFTGESASDGEPHNLTYACSGVRFKNHRHDEFEVRTAAGKHDHFAPLNPSEFHLDQLQSACAK